MLILAEIERLCEKAGINRRKACLAWMPGGRSFVIRPCEFLDEKILPMISCPTKFSSFLRKLYRWGFRQVVNRSDRLGNLSKAKVFMHPYFQRDNASLMDRMKSITAEGTRKEIEKRAYIEGPEAKISKQMRKSGVQEKGSSSFAADQTTKPLFQQLLVPQAKSSI
jgi:hypothetical protein